MPVDARDRFRVAVEGPGVESGIIAGYRFQEKETMHLPATIDPRLASSKKPSEAVCSRGAVGRALSVRLATAAEGAALVSSRSPRQYETQGVLAVM